VSEWWIAKEMEESGHYQIWGSLLTSTLLNLASAMAEFYTISVTIINNKNGFLHNLYDLDPYRHMAFLIWLISMPFSSICLSQNNQCLGKDLNPGPSKCEAVCQPCHAILSLLFTNSFKWENSQPTHIFDTFVE
jgi:hypothetical protein